uniref:Uncharacterized protein n=1 Tax=Medicago truncatula TaxID=3880 RepID=A2Q4M9_MEDTR|nr:hypothetical protein MtrDRAFT_AC157506g52v2 [Medicago truncatula]
MMMRKLLNLRRRRPRSQESSNSWLFSTTATTIQSVPKKKRKQAVRKLKVADHVMEEEDQIEVVTDLVTKEIRNKKTAEEAVMR